MSNVVAQKKALRKESMLFRKNLSKFSKRIKDKRIFRKILKLKQYKTAETLLCYYSIEYEIDTVMLINHSLKKGKKVALPLCLDNEGNMTFKYIMSTNELSKGFYGIPEPPKSNATFNKVDKAICIVPSLMIDKSNYRLGYGKGFYDRFLKDFNGTTCVICYHENVIDKLPCYDGFDIKCDISITD